MKKLGLLISLVLLASMSVFAQQSGKSIRITGIEPRFTGFWILYLANDADYNDTHYGDAQSVGIGFTPYNNINYDDANSFDNGTLTGLLFKNFSYDSEYWNDSGDYYIVIYLIDWEDYGYYVYISRNKISFRDTITEIAFSDFIFTERLEGQ